MNPAVGQRLYINRNNLHQAHVGEDPDAPAARPLQTGEVRLRVQRFALTANNITYAAFGQTMKYWQFFPAPNEASGCLPVWGFAQVVESLAEDVTVGRRVYGYWPAGTHLVVQAARVSARGFVDAAAHRQELAAIYNQYSYTQHSGDSSEQAAADGLRAVLQPLFMTAFLLDDFLAYNHFFGAQLLLLSSASSKTAMATAYGLALRRGSTGQPQVVGLTSPGNVAFTKNLGCYDQVLPYADLNQLPAQTPAVYVDFAGSASVRAAVHGHFGDQLLYSSAIGGTHWNDLGSAPALPGPRPTLFFAPKQAAHRSAPPPAGWGRDVVEQRMAQAWQAFVARVSDGPQPWVTIVNQQGPQAVVHAYTALLEGKANPQHGLMLAL